MDGSGDPELLRSEQGGGAGVARCQTPRKQLLRVRARAYLGCQAPRACFGWTIQADIGEMLRTPDRCMRAHNAGTSPRLDDRFPYQSGCLDGFCISEEGAKRFSPAASAFGDEREKRDEERKMEGR